MPKPWEKNGPISNQLLGSAAKTGWMDKFVLSDLFIIQARVINGIPLSGATADFFVDFFSYKFSEYKSTLIFIRDVTGKKYSLIIHRAVAKSSVGRLLMVEKIKKVLNTTSEAWPGVRYS